ncbi:hypothetical protein PVAP13_8NG139301 [Panicum virgatum]|uniref:Uncharacterized protein n=1 Tax=Panicum virgatum TaxID=38727 RepID=A0A8T0PB69_PANVG|nr:hypothetical protein PVAP13_8NG139301 [Panicum virgatum]
MAVVKSDVAKFMYLAAAVSLVIVIMSTTFPSSIAGNSCRLHRSMLTAVTGAATIV